MTTVRFEGDRGKLTPFLAEVVAALEKERMRVTVRPMKALASMLEIHSGNSRFWVLGDSTQGKLSHIAYAYGALIVQATNAAELVERFHDRLVARLTQDTQRVANDLGLVAEISYRPRDESDR